MTVRVLVADDQAMVREGLRMILDLQEDIEVVAEAGDGRAALYGGTLDAGNRPGGGFRVAAHIPVEEPA